MNLANKYTSRCTVLSNRVTCANRKQRKLIWLKKMALLLKVNTIIWISKNQQSQKNPMKCTDTRTVRIANTSRRTGAVRIATANKTSPLDSDMYAQTTLL